MIRVYASHRRGRPGEDRRSAVATMVEESMATKSPSSSPDIAERISRWDIPPSISLLCTDWPPLAAPGVMAWRSGISQL